MQRDDGQRARIAERIASGMRHSFHSLSPTRDNYSAIKNDAQTSVSASGRSSANLPIDSHIASERERVGARETKEKRISVQFCDRDLSRARNRSAVNLAAAFAATIRGNVGYSEEQAGYRVVREVGES